MSREYCALFVFRFVVCPFFVFGFLCFPCSCLDCCCVVLFPYVWAREIESSILSWITRKYENKLLKCQGNIVTLSCFGFGFSLSVFGFLCFPCSCSDCCCVVRVRVCYVVCVCAPLKILTWLQNRSSHLFFRKSSFPTKLPGRLETKTEQGCVDIWATGFGRIIKHWKSMTRLWSESTHVLYRRKPITHQLHYIFVKAPPHCK